MATITRQENNNLFGPTVGDKIRLGDTDLYIEIERDLRRYGDEVVYGGGKTLRDGMGLANTITRFRLTMDDEVSYSVEDNDPCGTVITLRGPLHD